MEQIKILEFRGSLLNYVKSGEGKNCIITFHGFGQSIKDFAVMEAAYPSHTFYHIGLFFHQSFLHKTHRPLTPDIWLQVFARFLKEENIDKFSLAGFSIGCRLIYSISECYAQRLNGVLLLSPEGEKLSGWYRAGVTIFRGFLKYFIFRPVVWFSLLDLLVKVKLLNKSVGCFARSQMKTRNKRWQVYMTWINFRLLRLDLKRWSAVMNQTQIPVTLVTGKNDLVIPAGSAKAICKQLMIATHYQIKAGHQDLLKRSAEFLKLNQNY